MSLKSTLKGMFGEAVVNVTNWFMLDRNIYHRINNVTLPLPDGGSTQIDHIIVSVYGIFVIETKNYKGWIFGSEKDAQWTQSIHGYKYRFQNPLRQNYLHVKTLANLLALNSNKFHSVIMFIGNCELKTREKLPDNVMKSGLVSYIKGKQTTLLTPTQVSAIVAQINRERFAKSRRTNAKHKAYLKDKHHSKPNCVKSATSNQSVAKEIYLTPFNEAYSNIANSEMTNNNKSDRGLSQDSHPNCPKCQSKMVKRTAKSGSRQGQAFWGCSHFPKCRGTINI